MNEKNMKKMMVIGEWSGYWWVNDMFWLLVLIVIMEK